MPCRSKSVWSLTAALERWNGAQGNSVRQRSMVVAIERVDGLVEIDAEAVLGIERARDADERLGEVGMNAPIAQLVGVGRVLRDTLARMPM